MHANNWISKYPMYCQCIWMKSSENTIVPWPAVIDVITYVELEINLSNNFHGFNYIYIYKLCI